MPSIIPPSGLSPDRVEVDVPLDWLYVVSAPAPTGSAPNVVVGARLPCGYAPEWALPVREGGVLRVRLRARFSGRGAPPSDPLSCREGRSTAVLASLSVLRLGAFRVTDATPRRPGEPEAPAVTLAVVPDDTSTPSPVARWARPCRVEADCASGGLCVTVQGLGVCVPPLDPWRSAGRPCPEGAVPVEVSRPPDRASPWPVCLPSCAPSEPCPPSHRCSPLPSGPSVCLPSAVTQDAGAVPSDTNDPTRPSTR